MYLYIHNTYMYIYIYIFICKIYMSVYIYMQVYICIHMYIYMLVCKNPLFSCNLCSFQVACLLSTLRRVSIFATSLDELISRADQLEPAIIS